MASGDAVVKDVKKRSIVWLPRFRFYTLFTFAGIALFVPILDLLRYTLKGDFWWVWNSGRWMAVHHHILLVNPSTWNGSALAGKPWVNLEWAWQWFIYAVNPTLHPLNYTILLFVFEVVMLLAFVWTARAMAPGLSPEAAVGLYALFSIVVFPFTVRLRAELFSYAAFPVLLGVLWRGRRDIRWFWALPPLTLIWANVHGSWLMIPVLAALQFGQEVWRRAWKKSLAILAAGVLGPMAVTTLATPDHLRTITYAWWLDHNHYISGYIQEWQSINFHQTTFLVLGVVIFAAWLWRVRTHTHYPVLLDIWFIGVTLAFFDEIRMITYFGVVFALWIGYGLARRRRTKGPMLDTPAGSRVVHWALGSGMAAALVAGIIVTHRMQHRFLMPPVPLAVVSWVNRHPHGVVLAPIDVGGYLEAKGVRAVFADGRSDFFLANGTRFQNYVTLITGNPDPSAVNRIFQEKHVTLVIWPGRQVMPSLGWFFLRHHWKRQFGTQGWAVYTAH